MWIRRPAGDASKLAAREPCDVGIDFAGHHHAVVGQRLGHRQRRVSGEHADLEHPARAAEMHQELEGLPLDVARQHLLFQTRW